MKKLDVPMLSLFRLSFVIMLLCGLLYPLAMTAVAQATMKEKANGSMIYDEDGQAIGSEFIGQSFRQPGFFHGRVSSIVYDGGNSGSENYAPGNLELLDRVNQSLYEWVNINEEIPVAEVPIDLLTNSASGLDPHISPEAGKIQIPRISAERNIDEETLTKLVEKHTEGRNLGIFGTERVNVLQLNLALLEFIE